MNNFNKYISEYKSLAIKYNLDWDLIVNSDGSIENPWDLTALSNSMNRQCIRLNNFAIHRFYKTYCKSKNIDPKIYKLTNNWQDLIKAFCIEKLIIDKIKASSIQTSILQPLQTLGSFLHYKDPDKITSSDVSLICKEIREITGNNILSNWILAICKNLIDKYFLSVHSPITVLAKSLLSTHQDKRPEEILQNLKSRASSSKLPNKDAFWELIRIIFTIEPKSYIDQIKFAQIQLLVMTGLRIGEIVKLPKDCIVGPFKVLKDDVFKSNKQFGAIKEFYKLKYFAEKQISGNRNQRTLEVAYYAIPPIFLEPIKDIISLIEQLSSPLRNTLIQIENNYFPINKKNHKFISAIDVYLLITGNSNFIEGFSDKIDEIKKLDISERYSSLERHIEFQKKQKSCQFTANFYEFFQKLKKIVMPYNPINKYWISKINWWDAQFKVSEIAIYLELMPSKQPDLYNFITDTDETIKSSDFLFLYPKRAILETRNEGLIDISRVYSIGVPDRQFLETFLNHCENTTPTIFEVYSDIEHKNKKVMPHSLQHLLNTELYRKGLSTLAITKQFNRKELAQTLVYDHRSLLEKFE